MMTSVADPILGSACRLLVLCSCSIQILLSTLPGMQEDVQVVVLERCTPTRGHRLVQQAGHKHAEDNTMKDCHDSLHAGMYI